ncbi:MAG: bifunctional phosphopantothenoylcysteine decarboxylase/phosphopantothenate--cysteine ligase CoaBC [Pseudomonadota bacterium]
MASLIPVPSRRVLLVIGGGIAAYKSLELIRLLRKNGAAVKVVLTPAAREFITPLSVASLSENPVYQDLFDTQREGVMDHIALSRWADQILIAPASANLLARMALGLADDLATTLLLAATAPVHVAPAMNVRMWQHPATVQHIKTLATRGVTIIPPEEGEMACGEYGPGRMADPAVIAALPDFAGEVDASKGVSLRGYHAVVTSGPTREAIDPVRFLSNHSSGKQGHAIAAALARAGARCVLVSGPTAEPDPTGVTMISVGTAQEMYAAVHAHLPADIFIGVAAVSDWRLDEIQDKKIKKIKKGDTPTQTLQLIENPDILKSVSQHNPRPALVIGFAAETDDPLTHARAKRKAKGCDWLVVNHIHKDNPVFGASDNQVSVISSASHEDWPRFSKTQVAERLVVRIAQTLHGARAKKNHRTE